MTSEMSPEAAPMKYATVCRICGHEFHSEPFVPIVGTAADARRQKMGQVLTQHAMTEHSGQILGFLLAACFQFGDPVILQEMEAARWTAHQLTAKNFIPDQTIEHNLAGQGFDAEQIQIIKDLRDLLTETGKYAAIPQQPEPSLVV